MNKRMIAPVLIGILGVAVLLNLGFWQSKRLIWKQDMLAQIDARLLAEPVALETISDFENEQFTSVQTAGRFTGEELHVLASTRDVGAVYRIVAVFETSSGRRIIVDRGIIPTTQKDVVRPPVAAAIAGNIRFPDEIDSFNPKPDLNKNIWFARDARVMSKVLNTDHAFIVLRKTDETSPQVKPLPLDSSAIPNNHLNYAITWFLMALAWFGMTGFWLWRIRRRLD